MKARAEKPDASFRKWIALAGCLVLTGAAAFGVGVSGDEAQRAWQAYLVNFLFWTGLALGSVLISAVLTITHARWGRPVKRLAEAPATFLPLAFVLFWLLYLGKDQIFPWIREPIPQKAAWLNPGFLFARDGLSLFLLTALALGILYFSVRDDLSFQSLDEKGDPDSSRRRTDSGRAQAILSPIYAILYAFLLTLLALDLVMSLSPHWYSTLFGAYFFMGAFYCALAGLVLLSALGVSRLDLDKFIGDRQFHDLGKLLFAFCVVTGDFFYSQFLVIWYGNLPEETRYVLQRVRRDPWDALAWTVLFLCFVIPFVLLLSRRLKLKRAAMMVLSLVILVGMWLERFLLVAPSIHRGSHLPIGILEVLITGGFFGAMALCLLVFFGKVPLLPLSDPLFRDGTAAAGRKRE